MEQEKNPMQKIKYFLFAILVLSAVIVFNSFKQPIPIKAEGKSTTINNLLQEQYYKELSLNLPNVIDTQNLEIVFANPNNNPKKYPITIIIDNKKFEKAKSPFKLPDLEIGTHTITIKYTNKDGIPRTLSTLITVVPKAPILTQKNKTLFYRPEPITISGKALAFSKIMVIINSTDIQYIPVDSTGEWQFTIKSPKTGIYNLLFFTYKNGVISKNYAKIKIKYSSHQANIKNNNFNQKNNIPITKKIIFKAKNIINNKQYLYTISGIIILIILAYSIIQIKKWLRKKWEQKEIIELIKKQKPKKNIVKIIKKVEGKQTRTNSKAKKEGNSNFRSETNTKSKKNNKKRSSKQTTNDKNKPNKNKTKKQKTKQKLEEISIQKKVLSKEEFLSMFKKSKNKS